MENEISQIPIELVLLSIETRISQPSDLYRDILPIRGFFSKIEFPNSIKDYKGRDNKRLFIKTCWFMGSSEIANWDQWIENMEGYLLLNSLKFKNGLKEPIHDYKAERLQKWLECGKEYHNRTLDKIIELYMNNEILEETFSI